MRNWWDTTSGYSTGVPFAVDSSGQWRDVSSVENGKSCDCFCAECQSPLIARQGDIRAHHFAHQDRSECREALEASLFGMALHIMRTPGTRVSLPPPITAPALTLKIKEEEFRVRHALNMLEIASVPTSLVLGQATVLCERREDSTISVPEIADATNSVCIHFLSSHKSLTALATCSRSTPRVLALNPIAFGHEWLRICDPRRSARAEFMVSATAMFREWIATTLEDRGWAYHHEAQGIVERISAQCSATRAERAAENNVWNPSPEKFKEAQKYSGPDVVLQEDAAKCSKCSGSMNMIKRGHGPLRGMRYLVCQMCGDDKYLGP